MSVIKLAIVTGANKGIGYAIVKGLCAKFDGQVLLTARDVTRGTEAIKSLNQIGLKPLFHQLDVTDLNSIRLLKNHIRDEYGGIDVLVNNAGIMILPKAPSQQTRVAQAKETIRVNYSGLRNVSDQLMPMLRSHARVVNLSSVLGHLSYIPSADLREKFSDINLNANQLDELMEEFVKSVENGTNEADGWPGKKSTYGSYIVSKVGVSALTRIHQRQLAADRSRTDIIVNSVHPGYVITDMTSLKGYFQPERGARSSLYAALLPPNVDKPKGEFIWHTNETVDWVHGPLPKE